MWEPKARGFRASSKATHQFSTRLSQILIAVESMLAAAGRPALATSSPMGLIAELANSTYHAMQLSMNRRFAQGLYFTTSYTLSKSLDYVSSLNQTGSGPNGASGETDLAQNPFNLKAEHGPSIFDARHRWVMSASWEVPILKNSSRA